MIEMKIQLAVIWIVVMLIYLLGDVLRIFSGDILRVFSNELISIKIGDQPVTQLQWLGISILMVIPILMIFFSISLDYSVNRWANIIVAVFFLLFNLFGLPTYSSAYDRFLLVVSMVFNGITIWYAWNWVVLPTV